MVQSFNQDNISAFGGLALAAIVYQIFGAILGWLVTELFYVPSDFYYGAVSMTMALADADCGECRQDELSQMGMISNWANLPTAVVQTIGKEQPFAEGDVDLGVAYIA
jgi:hypothetical protein